jgi:transmembrane sensor
MARSDSRNSLNKQISDEAAEWFVEFSTGESDARARGDFDTWLRKSPEHVRAYLEMFPIWEDAGRIDSGRTASTDELISLARSARDNVVPLVRGAVDSRGDGADESARHRRTMPMRLRYTLAASLLATVATGVWFYSQAGIYATDIGEQRVVTLPDGSNIELDARSRIRLQFKDAERRVQLLAGQALFRVSKDAQRPFIVESGATEVRAVGTQFDVKRKQGGIVVTVVEGQVAVGNGVTHPRGAALQTLPAEVLLSAGEQVTVTPIAITQSAAADVESATAWRQRRLVFSSTPLPEVADEFNRYNERQLVVGPALDTFRISAVFSASDIPALLRFLRVQPNLVIEESDREIRISASTR